MTKEFLTKLGVSEEMISQILAENNKDCDGVSAKFGDYEDVKSQLSAANKQIEEFGKLDYEGLKKTADDYKEKLAAAQKIRDSRRISDEVKRSLTTFWRASSQSASPETLLP